MHGVGLNLSFDMDHTLIGDRGQLRPLVTDVLGQRRRATAAPGEAEKGSGRCRTFVPGA